LGRFLGCKLIKIYNDIGGGEICIGEDTKGEELIGRTGRYLKKISLGRCI